MKIQLCISTVFLFYNTKKRGWQDIRSVFPLAISNKHCFPWMKCVSFPALHRICTASLIYLSNLSCTVTTTESKTLFRQKDKTNKRWKIKRLFISFSLGISKWGWFHAPVIRAIMRRDEREGGQGWGGLQGAKTTNVSAYVFISEVGAQQMGTESTSWNEGKEAGKDREKIERGGEGLVQVCLWSLSCKGVWRVRSGERWKA